MTIKEMEEKAGLARANIRFYEAEGLFTPERKPNGYRDYSQEDLTTLLRVRLLRSLGVSLEDIKAVQAGDLPLAEVLGRHLDHLAEDKDKLTRAEGVCREMREAGEDYAHLDAEKYLEALTRPQPVPVPAPVPESDAIPKVRSPWRRFFARELDSLQPVQVFLSTLHVLESTLQNNSVAIYECNQGNDFTRLVVRSREMKSTPRSMRISEYAPMYDVLKKGKLYANHNLTDGYPVYALPVMDQGEIIAVLMLWNVPFEQQSLYMENLLSVVAGLVQSALIRAIGYHRQVADLYYENTHILMPQAFMTALGIYQTIRSRHMGTHVLVRLHADREMDLEVIDRYIGKLVRSTDLVGRLEDGRYYVLFPQASAEQLPGIEGRFNSYGIRCEVVSGDLNIA